ncbi:hypothetical protein CDAR_546521 [Caerostris darwini]|uniref:Uncharacterized protein n=1 Tax=Caerostris darwini TaxID=1538125 RepID=A0AAV4M3Q9_9ARAC|nr:hypothetical protein CDAR_546521 [Caerostris darwini]
MSEAKITVATISRKIRSPLQNSVCGNHNLCSNNLEIVLYWTNKLEKTWSNHVLNIHIRIQRFTAGFSLHYKIVFIGTTILLKQPRSRVVMGKQTEKDLVKSVCGGLSN